MQERLRQAELAAVESQTKAAEKRRRRRLAVALAMTMLGVLGLVGYGVYSSQQQVLRDTMQVEAALSKTVQLRDEARAVWAKNRDASRWARVEEAADDTALLLLTRRVGDALRDRVKATRDEAHKEAAAVRDDSVLLSELAQVRAPRWTPILMRTACMVQSSNDTDSLSARNFPSLPGHCLSTDCGAVRTRSRDGCVLHRRLGVRESNER